MIDIKTCPICNGKLSEIVFRFPSRPYFASTIQGVTTLCCSFVTYVHCDICGVYVQNPRMSDEDVQTYYRDGLYRQWLGMAQDEIDADERERAGDDSLTIIKLYGVPKSHLDIGSSRGDLLAKVGAAVQVGVEPNAEYNKNVKAEIVSSLSLVQRTFELVTMIHALEHVIDPIQTLTELKRVVADGGRLIVEVPSNESKGGWGRLAHLYHFPEWTMHYMARQTGWRIVHMLHIPHTFVVMEK